MKKILLCCAMVAALLGTTALKAQEPPKQECKTECCAECKDCENGTKCCKEGEACKCECTDCKCECKTAEKPCGEAKPEECRKTGECCPASSAYAIYQQGGEHFHRLFFAAVLSYFPCADNKKLADPLIIVSLQKSISTRIQ